MASGTDDAAPLILTIDADAGLVLHRVLGLLIRTHHLQRSVTHDWCLGTTFSVGTYRALLDVLRIVRWFLLTLNLSDMCAECACRDVGVLGKYCLLTRCDADADSGVRVFVGTIAWPLAPTMPHH